MLTAIRDTLLIPDAQQCLYPLVYNDGNVGKFRDIITGQDASLSGGSTLTGQAKFRNDFQRLNDIMLGYRAAPAWTNLLYALNTDAPSGEDGTVGGWQPNAAHCTITNSSVWARHGSRSFLSTVVGASVSPPRGQINVAAATAAGTQYTMACNLKNIYGSSQQFRLIFYDDVSGYQYSSAFTVANGAEAFLYTTKTFGAGSTVRYILVEMNLGNANQVPVFYYDAISLVSGSVVPMFTEAECTATSCTFPTAGLFSAGEDVSFLCFVWTPWAGDDSGDHRLIYGINGNNILTLYKASDNYLYIYTRDNALVTKYNRLAVGATNWPAGSFHAIATSLTAGNTQRLALDGTLAASVVGTGVRESALPANLSFGSTQTPSLHANGLIIPFVYKGVAWDDAMCQRMSSLQAPPPRMRRVA